MGPAAAPSDRLSPAFQDPGSLKLHRHSMLTRKLSALKSTSAAAGEIESVESNVVAVHAFWDEEARMLAMQVLVGGHACRGTAARIHHVFATRRIGV